MLPQDQLNDLIKKRRSVFPKQFVPGKRISDDIIRQLLINATWAPNHGGTEPWQFTVFSGEGLQKFAQFQSELYKKNAGENYKEETYLKLQTTPLLASHIIAIGMKRTTTKQIPEIEDIEAVACAVQNMYLTTTVYGIGGYWTTGGVTYKEEAKAFFGLGDADKLLGFYYVGHIATPSAQGIRKPIEEKVNWITG